MCTHRTLGLAVAAIPLKISSLSGTAS